MSEEQNWIKVNDNSELQGGMTVRITECAYCTRTHTFMMIRPAPEGFHLMPDGTLKGPICRVGWQTTPFCNNNGVKSCFAHGAIQEGRLFRLDTGDLSKTKEECLDDIMAKRRASLVLSIADALNARE